MSVYFIGEQGTEYVKIGYAGDPWQRLSWLQSGNPRLLVLLAQSRGGMNEEGSLHGHFAESRATGEWFRLTPKLQLLLHVLNPANPAPELDVKQRDMWLAEMAHFIRHPETISRLVLARTITRRE